MPNVDLSASVKKSHVRKKGVVTGVKLSATLTRVGIGVIMGGDREGRLIHIGSGAAVEKGNDSLMTAEASPAVHRWRWGKLDARSGCLALE